MTRGSTLRESPTDLTAFRWHAVVTMGTDHHRFDRLVHWVDRWAAENPKRRCLIQHGPAQAPSTARGVRILDPTLIPQLLANANIALGHAGPGTLLDARSAGRLPVMVPRLAAHDEVVDDHQVTFGRWMAERQMAICVETEEDLRGHLSTAITQPERYLSQADSTRLNPSAQLFGELVDGLLYK